MSREEIVAIDLSEEIAELEEILQEKLKEEGISWRARLHELTFYMEKFIESNKKYDDIGEKIENLKNKLKVIEEVLDEKC